MFDEKQNQKDICRALAWQHGDKDAAEALLKQVDVAAFFNGLPQTEQAG